MLTSEQIEFIDSLLRESKQKAYEILNKIQAQLENMTVLYANSLEDRFKLETKLTNRHNQRLERVALQILNAVMTLTSQTNFPTIEERNAAYSGCIVNSIAIAKQFIREIDNANS